MHTRAAPDGFSSSRRTLSRGVRCERLPTRLVSTSGGNARYSAGTGY